MDPKLKDLLRGLLQYYYDKEQELLKSGKPNLKTKIYTYHTGDTGLLSEFEKICNHTHLFIETVLPIEDCTILIRIFMAIYDKHYYMFDDISFITERIYENFTEEELLQEQQHPDIFSEENMIKIENYDLDTWLFLLNKSYISDDADIYEQYKASYGFVDDNVDIEMSDNCKKWMRFKCGHYLLCEYKETYGKNYSIRDIMEYAGYEVVTSEYVLK